jgi:lysophospholipase L1-like esterase
MPRSSMLRLRRRESARRASAAFAVGLLLLWRTCLLGASPGQIESPTVEPSAPRPEPTANCTKAARDQLFQNLAGFERYGAANAALPAPKRAERRVVFMGDSITDFWATIDPKFFSRSDFVDRGISGQTTMQMLLRFRQDVIALHPAVVHIMAGTNDIAGNTGEMDLPAIESNVASMVDLARANHIQAIIGSVLPATDFTWRPGLNPGPKVVALNKWLRSYCKIKRLVYVDYYSVLTDGALGMRSELTSDGVHPTLPGYRVMDPMARAAIRASMRLRVQ